MNNFQELREEAYKEIREMREAPLKLFLEEANINDNFFYEYKSNNKILTIYTIIPGIWIGFRGRGIKRLKEILKAEFNHDVEVEFKEIKGNFMSNI